MIGQKTWSSLKDQSEDEFSDESVERAGGGKTTSQRCKASASIWSTTDYQSSMIEFSQLHMEYALFYHRLFLFPYSLIEDSP